MKIRARFFCVFIFSSYQTYNSLLVPNFLEKEKKVDYIWLIFVKFRGSKPIFTEIKDDDIERTKKFLLPFQWVARLNACTKNPNIHFSSNIISKKFIKKRIISTLSRTPKAVYAFEISLKYKPRKREGSLSFSKRVYLKEIFRLFVFQEQETI